MAGAEDKAREEKLAAARKRVEQLKKQKGKKDGGFKPDGSSKTGPVESTAESAKSTAAQEKRQTANESADVEGRASGVDSTSKNGEATKGVEDEESASAIPSDRQPSLSIESKARSSSFRQGAAPLSPSASNVKSPVLPPLSPQGDTMTDIYRKQASRLEQLEKDNRRLERELDESEEGRRKAEDRVEELIESTAEVTALRGKVQKAESTEESLEKMRAEIASLQRQNAHLQSQSAKASRRISSSGAPQPTTSSASDLEESLRSKSMTIESMEVEISNLQAQLSGRSSTSTAHGEQVIALEEKLGKSEKAAEAARRELTDLKRNFERASERAVKEGSQRSSAETKMRDLERELAEGKKGMEELQRKCEALEKKVSTLTTLHKESEARTQAALKEREKFEQEVAQLRRKESARLRAPTEQKGTPGEGETVEGRDDDDVSKAAGELDDDERQRLQSRVRELEGEVFELRRGVWRKRRKELDTGGQQQPGMEADGSDDDDISPKGTGNFDDVDLNEGYGLRKGAGGVGDKGQSLSDLLTGGLSALTGGGFTGARPGSAGVRDSNRAGGYEEEGDDDDMSFDEDAFRRAHEVEEAERRRRQVERVKETKRSLAKKWQGWRLDLVESRAGGAGGVGEIFDV